MGEAYGLQTHIWNNNGKTVLLMLGFPVLLLLLIYALFLGFAGLSGATAGSGGTAGYFIWAGQALAQSWPFAIAGAILWFGIAYAFYQNIIDAATGAKPVERKVEPKLYNLLENLCISRGITMPSLRIIETDGLNAFATGLHKGNYSVTVTRGLMNTLTDEELEAVLAHELTHIRNADVRLLIIAVIFVGIFSFVGELAFRGLRFGAYGGGSSRRSSSSSDRGGGGAIVAIVVAIAIIAIAYALAIVIRFALSRRREYLADAGAVELTKNPDAMISALQKISGNAAVNAPSEVREMFIENPHSDFASIFATHPPIEKRIEVLMKYAGGRVNAPAAAPPIAPTAPSARPQYRKGPWG
ncbi:M48 family metallopeptidase [Terricaulis silvestris]|uniref:Protease HtpX n=1 Tax=Terricaulis silvestris TaxID=2686094 RepID=A0A6I6MMP2_9CAUL|nr:M48 family metallopeptidase [Terricaulis silvestris]QGZ95311.1 Protease HtpX [Terricaulis silvestris]